MMMKMNKMVVFGAVVAGVAQGMTGDPTAPKSLWEVEAKTLDGEVFRFSDYQEKVKGFLIANVATFCGFTDMGYEQLVELDKQFGPKGLKVIGAPCNQFNKQEPGTPEEILTFAKSKHAGFTMLEKMDVNGKNTHPLYKYLKGDYAISNGCVDNEETCEAWADQGECEANPEFMLKKCPKSCRECDPTYMFFGDIKWNFEYFLLDIDGEVMERFLTGTDLFSPQVQEALDFILDIPLEGEEGEYDEDFQDDLTADEYDPHDIL